MIRRMWQFIRGQRQPDEKGGTVEDYLTATSLLSSSQMEEAELLRHMLELDSDRLTELTDKIERGQGMLAFILRGRKREGEVANQELATLLDGKIDLTGGKRLVTNREGVEVNRNIEKLSQRLPQMLSRHQQFIEDHAGQRMDTYQIAMNAGLIDADQHKSKERMEALFTARAFQQMENLEDALNRDHGIFGFLKRMPTKSLEELADPQNIEEELKIYETRDGLSEKYLGAYILMLEYVRLHQDERGHLDEGERDLIHKLIKSVFHTGYPEMQDKFDVNYLVSNPGKWSGEDMTAEEALDTRLQKVTNDIIYEHAKEVYQQGPFQDRLKDIITTPQVTSLIDIKDGVTYDNIAASMRKSTPAEEGGLLKKLQKSAEMASLLGVEVDVEQAMQEAAIDVAKEHPKLNEDMVLDISRKLEQARQSAVRQSPVGGGPLSRMDRKLQDTIDDVQNTAGLNKE